MSQPRFLADHDLNEHIVDGVARREPGVEFIRARDIGLDGRPDPEVLDVAAARGLIVVSHDVNTMSAEAFVRIGAGMPMPGLFMVPQVAPIAAVIDSLIVIWSASEAEEWAGYVQFLPL